MQVPAPLFQCYSQNFCSIIYITSVLTYSLLSINLLFISDTVAMCVYFNSIVTYSCRQHYASRLLHYSELLIYISLVNIANHFIFQITDSTKVCSLHFVDTDIKRTLAGRRVLVAGAFPQRFSWSKQKKERPAPKQRTEDDDVNDHPMELDEPAACSR